MTLTASSLMPANLSKQPTLNTHGLPSNWNRNRDILLKVKSFRLDVSPSILLYTCHMSPAAWPRYRVLRSLDIGQYNLEISNAELSDDSLYECQATEAALRSRRAKLNVLSKWILYRYKFLEFLLLGIHAEWEGPFHFKEMTITANQRMPSWYLCPCEERISWAARMSFLYRWAMRLLIHHHFEF